MNYFLKGGQTSKDILFWMAELTRKQFPRSVLNMEGEYTGKEQLTVGLDDAMYARCCPMNGFFDLTLRQDNGDTIVYEAAYPRVLRVNGLSGFVNEVMALPPPEHHLKLSYGNLWTNGQFQIHSDFMDLSATDQLRGCLKIAKKSGMNMQVSSVENGGRATSVTSSAMLLGYKELIDIILRKDSETWILLHMATGMVYTSGFKLITVEELLSNIIITE